MAPRAKIVRPPVDSRPKNKLLACLPPEAFESLRPHLRTRPTRVKQVFYAANDPIRDVIFINGGVASVTAVMQDGTMVETATIGDEGLLESKHFSAARRRSARR